MLNSECLMSFFTAFVEITRWRRCNNPDHRRCEWVNDRKCVGMSLPRARRLSGRDSGLPTICCSRLLLGHIAGISIKPQTAQG
jgi:hypothetical protein